MMLAAVLGVTATVLGAACAPQTAAYIELINAPALATPEGDRAWPLYRAAAVALPPLPEEVEVPDDVRDPNDPRWPALAAYLDEHAGTIEMVRRAAARPVLGYVYSDQDDPAWFLEHGAGELPPEPPPAGVGVSLMDVRAVYIYKFRLFARLLSAHSRLAAARGDAGAVVADLRAMLGLARHARGERQLPADLLAFAIIQLWSKTISDMVADASAILESEDLRALAVALTAAAASEPLRPSFDWDHALFQEALGRCYSREHDGDGYFLPDGITFLDSVAAPEDGESEGKPVSLARMLEEQPRFGQYFWQTIATRRAMQAEWDRLCELADDRLPLWEWRELPMSSEIERVRADPHHKFRYMIVHIFRPTWGKSALAEERVTQQMDATLVALAVERFRRDSERLPGSLDELIPEYLDSVPPDRFTGQPLLYRADGESFLLYSAGADRDDDGGREADDHGVPSRWVPPGDDAPDGDWILWPHRR